jgi:hypothetical protein
MSILGLKDLLSDQLWCLAFKDPGSAKAIRADYPYLDMMKVSNAAYLGRCDELCINYGFYDPELNSYRWTGQSASLFIEVPPGYTQMRITLHTVNPEIANSPVGVKLYLAGSQVMKLSLKDHKIAMISTKLKEGLAPGPAELKLEVDRTFIPKEHGMNEDGRVLGVAIHSIEIL